MRSKPHSRIGSMYLEIYSKFSRFRYEQVFEVHPEWRIWYEKTMKCVKCNWPKRELQEHPKPLEVHVVGSFAGVCTPIAGAAFINVVRHDLHEALKVYLPPSTVWGDCLLRSGNQLKRTPFSTCYIAKGEIANNWRGLGCRHMYCAACNRIGCPHFGKEAFVLRNVRNSPIVLNHCGSLFIQRDLAIKLKLRERFEDIRFLKVPVVDQPQDGWILPGDPGWTGTLVTPPGMEPGT